MTLDPEVSHLAKHRARQRGTSVSEMVEELLRDEIKLRRSRARMPAFAARWLGKFALAERSGPRSDRLRKKYLKESQ